MQRFFNVPIRRHFKSESEGSCTASMDAVVNQPPVDSEIIEPGPTSSQLDAELEQRDGVRKQSGAPGRSGIRPGVGCGGLRAGLWLKVEASRRQNDPRKATCGR